MRQHRCVVSDEAWAWMEPLLPSSAGRRGGRWRDHRQVIEAISWRYRTGSPWRGLPQRFGPGQTAYERVTRGGADGTWARLFARGAAGGRAGGGVGWVGAGASTGGWGRLRRGGGGVGRAGWGGFGGGGGASPRGARAGGRWTRAPLSARGRGGRCGGPSARGGLPRMTRIPAANR